MTLNILFFTITIKKHKVTPEEAAHREIVDSLFEEHRDRQISVHHLI
ncbi:YrzI family small protein [Neobacillus sp. Marseille-QA0830]